MKYIKYFENAAAIGGGVEVDLPNVSYLESKNTLFVPGNSGTATVKVNSTTGEIEAQTAPTYEYVDLGLSVLWAKCNVGAETETDYGLYFAWGETQGYEDTLVGTRWFMWERGNYKWGSWEVQTKYNSTDGKTTLDLEDDAANSNMGGNWRMPTKAEYEELTANTTSQWVTNYNGSGVNGRTFMGNGQTLFIPAAGRWVDTSIGNRTSSGCVWSSSLKTDNTPWAWCMYFDSSNKNMSTNGNGRCDGMPVRGVLPKN